MNEHAPRRLETKVGVFFFIGLVILGVITFQVQDMGTLFRQHVTMTVKFPHAAGLNPGDTVTVAGLKVGEIQKIELLPDGVRIVMQITDGVKIKTDATATIAWGGLLGNRYVDISLGSPDSEAMPPNSEIPMEPSVELTAVLKKIENAATKFENMLAEGDIGASLSDTLKGISELVTKVKKGEGTVGKLFNDDSLYKDIAGFSSKLNNDQSTLGKLVNSADLHKEAMEVVSKLRATAERVQKIVTANEKRITSIMENLDTAVPEAKNAFGAIRELSAKVDKGEGILPALLSDKKMRDDLKRSLDRMSSSLDRIESFTQSLNEGSGLAARLAHDEELADNLSEAVQSLKTVAARIEKGDSTVARLTRDGDVYEDIQDIMADVRETLRRVKEQVPVGTFASVLLSAF